MNTERIHIRNRILVPQHRLLQTVPINIDTRVAHIIIADLHPYGHGAVYICVIIVARTLVICKFLVRIRIILRSRKIRAVSKYNRIRLTDYRCNPVHPALIILNQAVKARRLDIPVPPGMTCKFIPLRLKRLRNLRRLSNVRIPVEIRIVLKPDLLVIIQPRLLAGLIDLVRPVTEHAVVTRQRDHAVRIVIREIRMRIDER